MKQGSPGFIGARLRAAREARGLSPQQLAELLEVSKQTISQYENGAQTPRPEVMERLPQLLNVHARFFFRPVEREDVSPLFWRSLHAATKTARQRASRRQDWLIDVIGFVEAFVELPPPNIPELDLPSDPTALTDPMIEEAATALRRYWKLGDGAISDCVLLLENNGIIVASGELWADTLDAFSRWYKGRPFVFLGSEKPSAARARLNACHELAHLLLHRSVTREMLARKEIFKLLERQAHHFAGAFLLPATAYAEALVRPTLEAMRALKPAWGVSIGAQLMRAEQLNLVSPDAALWRSYARRGWRRQEPFDVEMTPERPRLLRRAIELMVTEGVMSPADIVNRFDIPARDIEELASLDIGYLEPRVDGVRLLRMPNRSTPTPNTESTGPSRDILEFGRSRRHHHAHQRSRSDSRWRSLMVWSLAAEYRRASG